MNNIKSLIALCFGCVMISFFSSCADENDCSRTGRPMMHCALVATNPDTKETKEYVLDSLTVTALGTDEKIINNQKNVKSLVLPLRYTVDNTVLIFQYDPNRNPLHADTLYITHKNDQQFQSLECGFAIFQTINAAKVGKSTSATQKHVMESAKIIFKEANQYGKTNLEIHYKHR